MKKKNMEEETEEDEKEEEESHQTRLVQPHVSPKSPDDWDSTSTTEKKQKLHGKRKSKHVTLSVQCITWNDIQIRIIYAHTKNYARKDNTRSQEKKENKNPFHTPSL